MLEILKGYALPIVLVALMLTHLGAYYKGRSDAAKVAEIARLELTQKINALTEQSAAQAHDAERKHAASVAALQTQLAEALKNAQANNADRLARANAGTVRLSIAAECKPRANVSDTYTPTSGADDGQRADLSATARQVDTDLRNSIERDAAVIAGLRDYARSAFRTCGR